MSMLDEVIAFVNFSFNNKGIAHFERTLYWLRYAKKDVSEAFQIAAYAHDIQRSIPNEKNEKIIFTSQLGFRDPVFLQFHQEQGALQIEKFLQEHQYPIDQIDYVKKLILKHEEGGDEDQNLLKDCDSLSFFETQTNKFLTHHVPKYGRDKVVAKFSWMYQRMTSSHLHSLAEQLYLEALKRLQ